MIYFYDDEKCELERKLKQCEDKLKTGNEGLNEECIRNGHLWFRRPYVGFNDVNYLICTRCGAEKTD